MTRWPNVQDRTRHHLLAMIENLGYGVSVHLMPDGDGYVELSRRPSQDRDSAWT